MHGIGVPAASVAKISPARRRVTGAHLKAARQAAQLTQDQLARVLDVRVPTVSERENNDDGVSWETWMAWAIACGLPLDWVPAPPEG